MLSTIHSTVRIIDTPGLGDVRGIEQDEESLHIILNYIASLTVWHGICVLLKYNTARLTVNFEYCIKELLAQLHRDACKKYIIQFYALPSCRGSNYGPVDAVNPLIKLLKDNDVDISLNRDICYCIDSEAVRYLAARRQACRKNSDQKNVSKSCGIQSITRTLVQDQTTRCRKQLINKRRTIHDLVLARSLADISEGIQTNISTTNTFQ